jgi:3-hydroxybutyrate dehydrogenase
MLANKCALITGSTSGIGLGIAHQLAKAGCNLVLHGLLPADQADNLVNQFKSDYGIEVIFSDADLRDPSAIKSLADMVHEQNWRIDILVNNAGIQFTAPVEEFPVEKWNDIIAINLSSSFHTMQQFLPAMQQNGWGRIINIASAHGLVASVNKAAYVSAKHGVVGLTKVAALENADKGITVNAICPGWVATPLIQSQIDDIARARGIATDQAKHELITAKQPRPEMAEPQHIGELVVFLCGEAAQGITGTSLPIDGGWTAQ